MRNSRFSCMLLGVTALAGVFVSGALTSAMAADKIRAIVALPMPISDNVDFFEYIKLINERGKGIVEIEVVGGPEVIPQDQQADAVRRGIVDMRYGPATHNLGAMPEADAFVGSTITAAEARDNGGFDVMRDAFRKRLGVEFLALLKSGVEFRIYVTQEPARTEDGGVDLAGYRLRSMPVYRAFFESLGAVPISVPIADVYTGLERNTFEGLGAAATAVLDFSWENYLKYQIEPGFLQTDLVVLMNPDKWEKLSPEARQIIEETSIEYEKTSNENVAAAITDVDRRAAELGIRKVSLEGEARQKFLDDAYGATWDRLKASGSEFHDALRATYFRPEKLQ